MCSTNSRQRPHGDGTLRPTRMPRFVPKAPPAAPEPPDDPPSRQPGLPPFPPGFQRAPMRPGPPTGPLPGVPPGPRPVVRRPTPPPGARGHGLPRVRRNSAPGARLESITGRIDRAWPRAAIAAKTASSLIQRGAPTFLRARRHTRRQREPQQIRCGFGA